MSRTDEFRSLWLRWNSSFISILWKQTQRRENLAQHQDCWQHPEDETEPVGGKETPRNSARIILPTQPSLEVIMEVFSSSGPKGWPHPGGGGLQSCFRTTASSVSSRKKKYNKSQLEKLFRFGFKYTIYEIRDWVGKKTFSLSSQWT